MLTRCVELRVDCNNCVALTQFPLKPVRQLSEISSSLDTSVNIWSLWRQFNCESVTKLAKCWSDLIFAFNRSGEEVEVDRRRRISSKGERNSLTIVELGKYSLRRSIGIKDNDKDKDKGTV